MKKKQSVIILLLCAVLTVLLGWTAIEGWGPTGTGSMKNIRTGLDLSGGVSITYQSKTPDPSPEEMNDTIFKLQQRVDQYSSEALVYQQGTDRINIEIPGENDANAILEELGKPGSLEFQDADGNTVLEGTDIADAQGISRVDQTTGQRLYEVELTMTEEGKTKFAEATAENVGKVISIVYDGEVISSPSVREAITGGSAVIDGMESLEEARNLASSIRIGALSLELEEIYSNVVGAQLGQNALNSSVLAGAIGVLIVVLFMIFVYRISGVAAGWALIVFTFLDLIALNAFDVTLTLPGIAGVVLTIGMAVDANVIIYARMREELTAGKGIHASIQAGFKKAFSAIFDGNITTLIAAAVLYALGTGSIRGFAVTLAMGIVLSMFSALAVSRVLSYAFYGIGIRGEKFYGKIKARRPFDFVGKRKFVFILSALLVLSGPVGMAVYQSGSGSPLNYSLDFVGGTSTTVDLGESLSLEELDSRVQPLVSEVTGDAGVQFQRISGTDQIIIKTRELSRDEREALTSALQADFPEMDTETVESENISSTISGEMRSNAALAVVLSVIFMLLYIWFRFRDIRFASSGVIALMHDVLIVLAFYVWSRFSVGSTFIAVMLTILGYSINATIVIFDRIRENLKVMRGESLKEIVNASITQTLTRSIYSSLTTFMTIFVLYLLGVPSVREFALPIIIGLVAGAYSSVCMTGPLWYVMKIHLGKNRAVETKEKPAELPRKEEEPERQENRTVQQRKPQGKKKKKGGRRR
jgi:SecD/SecF fusion protein